MAEATNPGGTAMYSVAPGAVDASGAFWFMQGRCCRSGSRTASGLRSIARRGAPLLEARLDAIWSTRFEVQGSIESV